MQDKELYAASQKSLFFILGPCVLEDLQMGLETADELSRLAKLLDVKIIFKSSFDKANRTSIQSYRGPGFELGLQWLTRIKQESGLPVTTDIHWPQQAKQAAQVADVLQIPAFLCRQTDLLLAAADTGRIVNVKKGQFMAPWEMQQVVQKITSRGNDAVWLTERGSSFGYNNLVVDFRSLPIMQRTGQPVVFDATHSVQLPGGRGGSSDGQREFAPVLARAAVAAGCNGLFMEVHPDPEQALCDGLNSLPMPQVEGLLRALLALQWRAHAG